MNDMSTCPPDIKMISNPPTPASSLEYPAQSSPSSSEDFYDKFDSLDNISSGEWRSVDEGIKRLSPAVENAASSEEDSYDSFDNLNDIRSEGWRAIEEDVKRLLPPLPASFITWNDEERTRTNMKPGSPESERAKVCFKIIINGAISLLLSFKGRSRYQEHGESPICSRECSRYHAR